MKIVIDVFGGDNAPHEIVKGCVEAINERKDLELILVGLEKETKAELAKYEYNKAQIELVPATEIIINEESPTNAIKTKKDSSLVKALDILKNRDDVEGLVSAGSSGALLTGAVLKVGRIKGVQRPALAALLPTFEGKEVCIIDCGANIDCKPEFLANFALMGCGFMKALSGIDNPAVGLLSNGVEDKKGNELTQATFKLLKEMPVNFVGNMEARDALTGKYDVIVCDGFAGNVLIKTVEGTAQMVMKMIKRSMLSSLSSKIGALFMKKSLKNLKKEMDYNARGGAPFVGIEKTIIKSHGSSNALAFKASIFNAVKMAEGNLVNNIKELIAKSNEKMQNTENQNTENKEE